MKLTVERDTRCKRGVRKTACDFCVKRLFRRRVSLLRNRRNFYMTFQDCLCFVLTLMVTLNPVDSL